MPTRHLHAIQHLAAPSWQARLFGASLRYVVKPVFTPGVPLVWQRRYLDLLRFTLVGPRGVRREGLELDGIPTVKSRQTAEPETVQSCIGTAVATPSARL